VSVIGTNTTGGSYITARQLVTVVVGLSSPVIIKSLNNISEHDANASGATLVISFGKSILG
jgi:hypothetical protein